ncbi:sterol desaturase family protein [Amycolatopsis sp. NPDC005003]
MKFKDPIKRALPAISVVLVAEAIDAIQDQKGDDRQRYIKDTATSVAEGLIGLGFSTAMRALMTIPYTFLYERVAPSKRRLESPKDWLLLFVAVDFLVYVYHRNAHERRLLWAGHQVHHSSDYLNVSTAFRRKWSQWFEKLVWAPLPLLGYPPQAVFNMHAWHLVYGVFAHMDKIERMPRWFEKVFVSPSHHRVHHGIEPKYIDKNYGSILIVWDKLFGTFQEEEERPTYGLTTPPPTQNVVGLQTFEFKQLWRDVRKARTGRERLKYLFGPPGSGPEETADLAPEPGRR